MVLIFRTGAAQNITLQISGGTVAESSVIDSVGYPKSFESVKAARDAAGLLQETLRKSGYVAASGSWLESPAPTSLLYRITLGKKVAALHIYIGSENRSRFFPEIETDTLVIPYADASKVLENFLSRIERKGYAMARLSLSEIRQSGSVLFSRLNIDPGQPRTIQDVIINGYEKFPEGHRRQLARTFKSRPFSKDGLNKIFEEINRFRFVTQTRYPEVLFTDDSTKVFVYVEKAKANRFDGFVGLFNNESEDGGRVRLNGYLDLQLTNILNSGEQFSLFWKSDGNDQKTFNASIDLPYIFKSRFALRAGLSIFRQDSTFQNTRTHLAAGYLFDYGMRSYLGYEATESSDIQNQTTASLSDFTSRFVTGTFDLVRFQEDDFLFPEKTNIQFKTGLGSRTSKLETSNQWTLDASAMHNFYLDRKNVVNVRSRAFYLKSDTYLVSELYRFGGVYSIRGFNENVLQANLAGMLLTEYRYLLTPGLYAHSIIDYGWMRDETRIEQKNSSLLAFGFGFGFLSGNGLFNLIYANGSMNDQSIELRNSIVHISFKSRF